MGSCSLTHLHLGALALPSDISIGSTGASIQRSVKSIDPSRLTCALHAGSNVVSVAEHVVMMILSLVRNYIPAYHQVIDGEWNIAKIAEQ